ncbi:hypothetical protein BV25DRAFT_910470 [Artomyces pyxidatus]|uniref:Uncharacterized protein n=1 Tax=Artomyces pyxidatus TaxID=48021 RepID=A0ACB8SXG1_9AGAM|nr:hypothetical protein BV25DRAFT_910470 [Artomyces pyxidatus]
MSAPSSYPSPPANDKSPAKRKDRPPALDIVDPAKASSRGDDRNVALEPHVQLLRSDPSAEEPHAHEHAHLPSRSASATSSLDPYYFSAHSPTDSPIPPLPDHPHQSRTPETRHPVYEPVTPHKDPASIDRRVLHGLGELATPRWARSERNRDSEWEGNGDLDDVHEGPEPLMQEEQEEEPDSPWTIEAVDGEDEERDEPTEVRSIQRTVRTRPSVTEESGGEEIVYPRQTSFDFPKSGAHARSGTRTPPLSAGASSGAPPSAFLSPLHKAKKRTSDEFELDQSGTLVQKHKRTPSGSTLDKGKDDKSYARKHRSLGVGLPPTSLRDRQKDRRRESVSSGGIQPKADRHVRQASATSSSSSSHGEVLHSRRVHTTDFSHLPPSPSTSSIQQFLRHAGSNGAITASVSYASLKESQSHHSPNVAHSLLRGTQEGWSDLDDQATAEALRKLDGLSGKTGARVRSSVSLRPSSSSRPGTPAKTTSQWEGVGSDNGKSSRRSSTHVRDSVVPKDKEQPPAPPQGLGLGLGELGLDASDLGNSAVGSSDEAHLSSSTHEKPLKKSNTTGRLSYSGKRGSASSTTYAILPPCLHSLADTPRARSGATVLGATTLPLM